MGHNLLNKGDLFAGRGRLWQAAAAFPAWLEPRRSRTIAWPLFLLVQVVAVSPKPFPGMVSYAFGVQIVGSF